MWRIVLGTIAGLAALGGLMFVVFSAQVHTGQR